MNRRFLTGVVILSCLCSFISESYACNELPYADITDRPTPYSQHVCVGETVTLDGSSSYDPDGYIYEWEWEVWYYDGSWHYDDTVYGEVTSYTVSNVGMYEFALDVQDDMGDWSDSSDYCYVYPVAVVDVNSSADVARIGEDITFTAITDPSGYGNLVEWSGDASGSGSQLTTNWSTPGTKTVTATCGTSSASTTVEIIDVSITTPSSYPAYVKLGDSLSLDCTSYGSTGGVYSWLQESGSPGAVTFSDPGIKNPTFSASQPGDYTVKVEYSKGGVATDDISQTITVVDIGVVIDTPASFPAYVVRDDTLSLDCTPSGSTSGFYNWTQDSGPPGAVTFSDSSAKNPSFSANTSGDYKVKVQYTDAASGITASKISGIITVINVMIYGPRFPARIALGDSQTLYCEPSGSTSGTYSWTQESGPPEAVTFTPNNSQYPTFSANQAGNYRVTVGYTVEDATAYDTSGTISVVEVGNVVEAGTSNAGPLYKLAGDSFTLEAKPFPADASCPGCGIDWIMDSYPTGGSWTLPSNSSNFTVPVQITVPGAYTIRGRCGPVDTGDTVLVNVFNMKITINIEDPLLDPSVNTVRGGLDLDTLKFDLNGTVIANSSLTLLPTSEIIDGEEIVTNLTVTYIPLFSELILPPGTNTVKVDIDDIVDNHMDQVIQTFQVPYY